MKLRSALVDGRATPAPLTRTERVCVSALSALQAAVFVWSAWVLPWANWTLFSVLTSLAGAAHAATVIGLLVDRSRGIGEALWKVSALSALTALAYVTWQVFVGGIYLTSLYGALGEGLFVAMLAIWGLFVLVTLPTACWALVRTRLHAPRLGQWPWFGAGATALAMTVGWLAADGSARARPVEAGEATSKKAATLQRLVEVAAHLPPASGARVGADATGNERLPRLAPVSCGASPTTVAVTWLATYRRRDGQGYDSSCFQAPTAHAATNALVEELTLKAARGNTLLDRIDATATLSPFPAWTSVFALRPGLDGLCLGTRCISPWQLLVSDAFIEHRPLSFLPDLGFGIDLAAWRDRLEDPTAAASVTNADTPVRITTESWVLSERGVIALARLRPKQVDTSAEALAHSGEQARSHILAAQLRDGKFRYELHPFTGKETTAQFTLPRQAGTLLALCELTTLDDAEANRAVQRGLQLLSRYERQDAAARVSGLEPQDTRRVQLENSALALVALVTCRERMGTRFDPLTARLTALVLSSQRADGGFDPTFDLDEGRAYAGHEPLYAPGQAILALTLLERLAETAHESLTIEFDRVRKARRAAMAFVAKEHWPEALRSFFFVEENWHCLAARAALTLPRDESYERFCLDYVAFRSRFVLDGDSDVDPAFVGGMGFGNVIPPHNTGAAGLGEALAAAITVGAARGQTMTRERAVLTDILAFLERQQWTRENCVGCVPAAFGAISEHMHSPITRIDFVQHAWSALAHGMQALSSP